MIVGKVWGSTELLLKTPFIEVHRLFINPNSGCSVHTHAHKWNAFYLEAGKLFIKVEKTDYDLTDLTELSPRAFTTVKPGEKHSFYTESLPAAAIEIYYPECLSEDIIRYGHGYSKSLDS